MQKLKITNQSTQAVYQHCYTEEEAIDKAKEHQCIVAFYE